ncbi:hypothetical protein FHR81_004356 [Actinoalloteichus hoggarensis]|nr:hypothetical protein [Actinoalloteichus hoggarensis]MBB5923289.1 hypothetical protein [Actinoalloteichus hoggarensis]
MSAHSRRSFTYYRRVTGEDLTTGHCTSQVELTEDRRLLYLRLASTARFAVLLDAAAIGELIAALRARDTGVLDVPHAERGTVALRIAPHRSRMSLGLFFTEEENIQIAFTAEQTEELIGHLAGGHEWIVGARGGGGP